MVMVIRELKATSKLQKNSLDEGFDFTSYDNSSIQEYTELVGIFASLNAF